MTDDTDRDDALLVNLVLIFQSAAMQQMGKIINPLSGKVDRNLEQARFSIDTLSMLKEKTRGNLSSDLERLLDSTLLQLRMNFVDESRSTEESRSGEESGSTDGSRSERGPDREAAGTSDIIDEGPSEGKRADGEPAGSPESAGSSENAGSSEGVDAMASAEVLAEPRSEPVAPKRHGKSTRGESGRTRRKARTRGEGGTREDSKR